MTKDIFQKRTNIKPYEYPQLLEFKDAIRHSYWLHTEFNLSSDIQDYKVNLTDEEREVVKRTMLAISQIEVSVKRFWADLYKFIPKPEIDDVGATFADSEVRHKDAYSFLIEQLGLNSEFENLIHVDVIKKRIEYLAEIQEYKTQDINGLVLSVVMFSLFVEHISLFGQFLILMSFNKQSNQLKGLSNIVEATSKEEEIHGKFGIELFNIIKEERPELFDDAFYRELRRLAIYAGSVEDEIVDWIYEHGDLEIIPKETVKNFIRNRFNKSMLILGGTEIYEINDEILTDTVWFDIEILSSKDNDFFNKKNIDYSKKNKEFDRSNLF